MDPQKLGAKLKKAVEPKHVLIETDGHWFRVVEIPLDGSLVDIMSVNELGRSNGTRWIKAN